MKYYYAHYYFHAMFDKITPVRRQWVLTSGKCEISGLMRASAQRTCGTLHDVSYSAKDYLWISVFCRTGPVNPFHCFFVLLQFLHDEDRTWNLVSRTFGYAQDPSALCVRKSNSEQLCANTDKFTSVVHASCQDVQSHSGSSWLEVLYKLPNVFSKYSPDYLISLQRLISFSVLHGGLIKDDSLNTMYEKSGFTALYSWGLLCPQ